MEQLREVTVTHLDHEERSSSRSTSRRRTPRGQGDGQEVREGRPDQGRRVLRVAARRCLGRGAAAIGENIPAPVLKIITALFGRSYRKNVAPVWSALTGQFWLPGVRREGSPGCPEHAERAVLVARSTAERAVLVGTKCPVERAEGELLAVRRRRGGRRSAGPARRLAASTITRTSGSVPEGRSRTRPVSPSSASASATAAASTKSSSARDLSTSGTLTSTCGSRVITDAELGERRAGGGHPVEDVQRGEDAVAGGRVPAHDHVAGLLAAEGEAGQLHRLEDVAVTHLRLPYADPGGLHRLHEAEVAHHGGHDRVVLQLTGLPHRQREDGQDLVAVDDLAVRVDREAAVGVAVEGEADVGTVLEDCLLQHVEVGRAAAVVDVDPVGLRADRVRRRHPRRAAPGDRPRRRRRGHSRARP